MDKKDSGRIDPADIRRRAEELLHGKPADLAAIPAEEARRLLHELQVHQIELEMQNDELRKAQQELDASRTRYFDLYDMAPVGYFTLAEEGSILEANLRGAQLLGVERNLLVRQPLTRYIHPEDQDVYYMHRKRLLETRAREGCELRMCRQDGSLFWVWLETSTSRDGENGPLLSRIVVTDITDRKKAEDHLKISEKRFRDISDHAQEWIWEVDAEGKYTYSSQMVERFLGYTPQEILQDHFYDSFHPEDRESLKAGALAAFAAKQPFRDFINRNVHKDGHTVWLSTSGLPLLDEKGNLIGYRGVDTDITDRKRAEVALSHQVQIANIFLAFSDEDMFNEVLKVVLDVTRSPFGVFGYLDEDEAHVVPTMTRQVWDKCRVPEKTIRFPRETWGDSSWPRAYREKKANYSNEPSTITPEGHVPIHRHISVPILLQGEPIGLFQVANKETDYTKEDLHILESIAGHVAPILNARLRRQRSEEKNARLKMQLQQAQKMEVVGRLAGGVAHDFNNLLTVITGYSELLLQQVGRESPMHGAVEQIQHAGERAALLTQQLLAFSRKQIIEPKVLDLNLLMANVGKMLVRLIEENVQLKMVPGRDLGRVKVDPGQFDQVLINLGVNARDAMPDGGLLLIETANVELDEEYCAQRPYEIRPGRFVMLAMSDTGRGMAKEVTQQIFEPFFTTKEKGKGTGLGLSMVYGAVKQSGGSIEVYSEVGKGTTFKIYLPRAEEEIVKPVEDERSAVFPGGTETLLLVEDEEILRKLGVRILGGLGYKVLQAGNGDEAISLAVGYKERIDLLLTDVVMPGMNGAELATQLVLRYPEMKVLFTSGYTDEAISRHGVLDEGVSFIGKPYIPSALARKVREVLDKA